MRKKTSIGLSRNIPAGTRQAVVFLVRDGTFLFVRHKNGPSKGMWSGVSTAVRLHEKVEQALVRGAVEAINVRPIHYWQVAEIEFERADTGREKTQTYSYVYFCDKWQDTPLESTDIAPQWFSIETIPSETIWQNERLWLPAALSGEKSIIKIKAAERKRHDGFHTVDTLPHEDELHQKGH